jgi:hypothetical protein
MLPCELSGENVRNRAFAAFVGALTIWKPAAYAAATMAAPHTYNAPPRVRPKRLEQGSNLPVGHGQGSGVASIGGRP